MKSTAAPRDRNTLPLCARKEAIIEFSLEAFPWDRNTLPIFPSEVQLFGLPPILGLSFEL
jgi:hypothetical protein